MNQSTGSLNASLTVGRRTTASAEKLAGVIPRQSRCDAREAVRVCPRLALVSGRRRNAEPPATSPRACAAGWTASTAAPSVTRSAAATARRRLPRHKRMGDGRGGRNQPQARNKTAHSLGSVGGLVFSVAAVFPLRQIFGTTGALLRRETVKASVRQLAGQRPHVIGRERVDQVLSCRAGPGSLGRTRIRRVRSSTFAARHRARRRRPAPRPRVAREAGRRSPACSDRASTAANTGIDGTERAAAVLWRFPADPQRKRTAHGAYPWAVLCLEGAQPVFGVRWGWTPATF